MPNTTDRLASVLERLEAFFNREIPNTPRITGRGVGGRVMYVSLPGSKRSRAALSQRASEVFALIERNRAVTSAQIQSTLNVNRNVVAGAIHELKEFKLVKPQPIDPQLVPVGTSGIVDGGSAHNRRATDQPTGSHPMGLVGRREAPKARRRRRQGRR